MSALLLVLIVLGQVIPSDTAQWPVHTSACSVRGQIDAEDLVFSLEALVEKFGAEISPYAGEMVKQLAAAYAKYSNQDNEDDEDDQGGWGGRAAQAVGRVLRLVGLPSLCCQSSEGERLGLALRWCPCPPLPCGGVVAQCLRWLCGMCVQPSRGCGSSAESPCWAHAMAAPALRMDTRPRTVRTHGAEPLSQRRARNVADVAELKSRPLVRPLACAAGG